MSRIERVEILQVDLTPKVVRTDAIQSFVDAETMRLGFEGGPEIVEQLVECSVAGKWRLREIQIEKQSLESVFSHLSNVTPSSL